MFLGFKVRGLNRQAINPSRQKRIGLQFNSASVLRFVSIGKSLIGFILFVLVVGSFLISSATWAGDGATWPGHRGEKGDGHVGKLPRKLAKVELLWRLPMPSSGVGGVSATDSFVVVSGRDSADKDDVFVCLDPVAGAELWRLQYPAAQSLDYGNSPRATPLIDDPWVYLVGAGGQLHCVDADNGEVKWKRHLVDDFKGERPQWGYGGSPLLNGERLIVQPGGRDHGIVAIDSSNGELVWKSATDQTGYASPQLVEVNNTRQIVGLDRKSLRGWDAATGESLWTVTPGGSAEFHVPMPLIDKNGITTIGEVHGARRYRWDADGKLSARFEAEQFELSPDMHSPVATSKHLFGVHEALLAITLDDDMEIKWRIDDKAFLEHCSLMIGDDRLLVVTERSELLLIDASETTNGDRILFRKQLSEDGRSLAHPALVGDVLYVRSNGFLTAWALVQ